MGRWSDWWSNETVWVHQCLDVHRRSADPIRSNKQTSESILYIRTMCDISDRITLFCSFPVSKLFILQHFLKHLWLLLFSQQTLGGAHGPVSGSEHYEWHKNASPSHSNIRKDPILQNPSCSRTTSQTTRDWDIMESNNLRATSSKTMANI